MSESFDREIIASNRSRIAGVGIRIGSVLLAGLGGYGASHHGLELDIGSWASVATSVFGAGPLGIRLGLERRAAAARLEKIEKPSESLQNPDINKARHPVSVPEMASGMMMAAAGLNYGTETSHIHPLVTIEPAGAVLFAGALFAASELSLQFRGNAHIYMRPTMHERLHLLPDNQ